MPTGDMNTKLIPKPGTSTQTRHSEKAPESAQGDRIPLVLPADEPTGLGENVSP